MFAEQGGGGGLPPVKDDNNAMRKFRPGYGLFSGRMHH